MKNLLLSYSRDLNDAYPGHEQSIWSAGQLLGFFNEALCLISAQRPDMFTEVKVIKVDPCGGYLDLCDCVKVLDVLGQCDKNGNNIRPIPRRKEKATVWSGIKKVQEFTTLLTEYELLDKSNLVKVYPLNLDPTKDIYIAVRCSVNAKTYSLTDPAPDERQAFLASARQWVLYRALSVDGAFSPTMAGQAQEHKKTFFDILGVVAQSDNDFTEKTRGS